jgi:hypothetical protein
MLVSGDVQRPSAAPAATRRRTAAVKSTIILLVVVVADCDPSKFACSSAATDPFPDGERCVVDGCGTGKGSRFQLSEAAGASSRKPLHEPISDPSSRSMMIIIIGSSDFRGWRHARRRAGRVHNCTGRRAWRAVRASKASFVVASHVTRG